MSCLKALLVYQPYELMFGCKAPTVCHAWPGLAIYNDNVSTSKHAWLNEQHQLLMSANRHALKHIKQNAKCSQTTAGGKTLHIPIGNLVLLKEIMQRVEMKFWTTPSLNCLLLLPIIRIPMFL